VATRALRRDDLSRRIGKIPQCLPPDGRVGIQSSTIMGQG
jgi:hypothetical protein